MTVRCFVAWLSAVALAGLCATGVASAAEAVLVFSPGEARCPAGRLPRTTIAEIAAKPGRFNGKCVRVAGVWAERALYADLDAYHRRKVDRWTSGGFPQPPSDSIGVYAPQDLLNRKGASFYNPVRADMIGRVGTCTDLGRGALIVVGYCHDGPGDPFLSVVDADLAPQRLVRLVSDADRLAVGDLAVMPGDWPARATAEKTVREWLRAFAGRDRIAMARLQDVNLAEHEAEGQPDAWRVDESRPPFSDLLASRRDRQTEVLVDKRRGAAAPDTRDERWELAPVGCVCREDDCTGRWPISRADAANSPTRPFVCLSLYAEEDKGPWTLMAPIDPRRVAEPE